MTEGILDDFIRRFSREMTDEAFQKMRRAKKWTQKAGVEWSNPNDPNEYRYFYLWPNGSVTMGVNYHKLKLNEAHPVTGKDQYVGSVVDLDHLLNKKALSEWKIDWKNRRIDHIKPATGK